MQKFSDDFLSTESPLTIVDIGSTEMGACYRPIFNKPNWKYIGIDLQSGPNVDLVIQQPYQWRELKSNSVDVLISGQVLEHIEFFWVTMLEISRVVKPGGMVCLIAPSSGPEHRYPVDCWRFYKDGMESLGRFARLDRVKVFTCWDDTGEEGSDFWHDSVGIYRKPIRPWHRNLLVQILQRAQHKLLTTRLLSSQQ